MLSDGLQRDQALDVSQSFIVQAPAGSGKTGVLTLRILKLLCVVEKPEHILAITFTKKAAAEMRVRVMEALTSAQNPERPSDSYQQQFYDVASLVLKRDQSLNWGLLKNQTRLRLLTIDAFCGSIVRNRPLSSGLGVQFSIVMDANELYKEAARDLLHSMDDESDLSRSLSRVMKYLDNQFSKLSNLICQMLSKRDHWLSDVVDIGNDLESFKQLLEDSLHAINAESMSQFYGCFNPDFKAEVDSLSIYASNQLHSENPNHSILQYESGFEYEKQKLKLFLTQKLEPRSAFNKTCGFPVGGQGAEKKEAAEFKARAKQISERLKNSEMATLDAMVEFITAPSVHIPDDQWQLLEDIILILRYSVAHLKIVFQQRQSVDFTEVALSALRTLGNIDQPSDMTLLLDEVIHHILVDEFQDTSILQVDLLEKLTAGWEPNNGKSLFLVGDPMQSIYLFRKADVGLFLRIWNQRSLGHVPVNPLLLKVNFRSSPAVIDWVNQTFKPVFPSRADERKGAVCYAASDAAKESKSTDGVLVKLFQGNKGQRVAGNRMESLWIAEQIDEQARDTSIAILVKGKSHIVDIVKALRDKDIAYQAVDIETLSQSQIITDLISMTLAYLSPSDKVSWYALLRGPWCGLTLQQLQRVAGIDSHPWMAINRIVTEKVSGFDADCLAKLNHIHTVFDSAYQQRHRQDWVLSVRDIALHLGISATGHSQRDIDAMDVFYELLESIVPVGDVVDLEVMHKQVGELFVPTEPAPEGVIPVQIMTMHKSKGLEFDVVFLPQLNRKGRVDDKPLIIVDKQTSLTSQSQELFVAPFEKNKVSDEVSVFSYLQTLQKQRLKYEGVRLMYVAATRAKRRLMLSGLIEVNDKSDVIKPDSGSLLSLLWPLPLAEIQSYEDEPYESRATPFRSPTQEFYKQLSCTLHADSFEQVASENTAKINENDSVDEAYDYHQGAGILVHRILENTATNPQWFEQFEAERFQPQWRQELSSMGIPDDDIEKSVSIMMHAVKTLRHSDIPNWLFSASNTDTHAEYSIATLDSTGDVQHHVIDLVFINNGIRYIVDYKLSAPEKGVDDFLKRETERYRDQLKRYKDTMNALTEMDTKTFLYFPLIDCLHEVQL